MEICKTCNQVIKHNSEAPHTTEVTGSIGKYIHKGTTKTGKTWAGFSVKDDSGTWHKAIMWDGVDEMDQYLAPNIVVTISGVLKQRSYKTKDGTEKVEDQITVKTMIPIENI